jgi:dihydroorotase
MTAHYDLIIRNGTCVLPWGQMQIDIGVREGRIARLGATAADSAERLIDATHLHVLPGLIDPHVHLRDPGDASVEIHSHRDKAARPRRPDDVCSTCRTPARRLPTRSRWPGSRPMCRSTYCDIGIYIGATKHQRGRFGQLETAEGVCAVKLFAGSTTGDLMVEDDETHRARDARRPPARLPFIARTNTGCRTGKMFPPGCPT